jgi:hypothetical protein
VVLVMRTITQWVMLAGIMSWILWDIVVVANHTAGDTISEITLALARRHPILPLAVGIVVGHLFGASRFVLPAVAFAETHPVVPLLFGIAAGAVCWTQLR